jgi:uncharacterized protein (TIGR03000 family)
MMKGTGLLVRGVCVVLLGLLAASRGAGQGQRRQPAVIVVHLPDEEAELTVSGERTRQVGIRRRFTSPPLQPGKEYFYTLTATWEPNNYTTITRTRKVYVRAGQRSEADLRAKDPKRPDDILIRFVPTPQAVVNRMLRLGGVGKGDVVYDLGCGDGRIVITAVAKFGARRGVGVDIDPERIAESRDNARKAGVTDKVEFRQQDVMKVNDLSSATVVMLYMGDDLNLQLRPILLKNLRPGSRIVSHRFTMGDWKPDRTVTMVWRGEKYKLHLWTIKEASKAPSKEEQK